MDFANRGNRPTQAPQQPAGSNNEQPSQTFQPLKKEKKSKGKLDFAKLSSVFMLFAGVFLIIAVIIGLVFGASGNGNSETDLIQGNKYQAIFLNSQDGQVYFGKLSIYNSDVYKLSDIYYVRVETPIQPEGANQQAQPNISLAKLGNELHGPQDTMFIARNKVLYWENLKDDGKVVTAITEYKKNGDKSPQQQSGTQQQPQSTTTPAPASTPAPAAQPVTP